MIKLLENTRRPDITFYRDGTIRITAYVARLLSLSSGDSINIVLNCDKCASRVIGTSPDKYECQFCGKQVEYLLSVKQLSRTIGRHEARCFQTNKKGNNYCAHSVKLCRAFFASIGFTGDKVGFIVGEAFTKNECTYLPIITKRPL